MSSSVVYKTKGANISLSFFFFSIKTFFLSSMCPQWRPTRLVLISFPIVPGRELKRNRSPMSFRETLCVKYLHRLWFLCWEHSLLDIHTGSCQRCWCTVHPGTTLAAPGIHWCLPQREENTWLTMTMCVLAVWVWWHVAVWPSKITVMGFGLKPSPPGHRVLYSAVTQNTAPNRNNQQQKKQTSLPQARLFYCRIWQ